MAHRQSVVVFIATIVAVGVTSITEPQSRAAPPEPTAESAPAVETGARPEVGKTPSPVAQPKASPASQSERVSNTKAFSVDSGGDQPDLTPGQRALMETSDGSAWEARSWSVMIYKHKHQIVLYYKGRLFKKYTAVFGRNRDGKAKAYEGDRRTPEGVYTILDKYPSSRYTYFLRLNYPNFVDRKRYRQMRRQHVVPANAGRVAGEGGLIGIHGTDVPLLNRLRFNWTTGCISVQNPDVLELARLVPIGTTVIIKP